MAAKDTSPKVNLFDDFTGRLDIGGALGSEETSKAAAPSVSVYPDTDTIGVWPDDDTEYYFKRKDAVSREDVV
ncbi:MAG TPA: hypothetical protein VE985_01875 [Gaiellaceae bacterium]|nr:hypothetical protein [Gaiellaceae bacterium]